MFNCVVSQSLSAINSAADSIKIISTDLWVFLKTSLNLIFFTLMIYGNAGPGFGSVYNVYGTDPQP
jgi:hypothetical protein